MGLSITAEMGRAASHRWLILAWATTKGVDGMEVFLLVDVDSVGLAMVDRRSDAATHHGAALHRLDRLRTASILSTGFWALGGAGWKTWI